MTEKLKRSIVIKLIREINENEFDYTETGDLVLMINKHINYDNKIQYKPKTLFSIYRKQEKGIAPIIENLSIRQCYNFLQGYKCCKEYYQANEEK